MREAVRGGRKHGWADPIILSLSKDQRRKAKAGDAANEAGEGVGEGEPDMFGDGASVAAE